jgi:hypothetical protein
MLTGCDEPPMGEVRIIEGSSDSAASAGRGATNLLEPPTNTVASQLMASRILITKTLLNFMLAGFRWKRLSRGQETPPSLSQEGFREETKVLSTSRVVDKFGFVSEVNAEGCQLVVGGERNNIFDSFPYKNDPRNIMKHH